MSQPVLLAEADAIYMKKISVWGDVRILLATLTGSGQGDQVRHG